LVLQPLLEQVVWTGQTSLVSFSLAERNLMEH